MRQAGLPLTVIIEKYFVPLLHATDVKLAQHEGQFTDFVELEDNTTRVKATDMSLRLLGAYPAADPVVNSKISVDMIITDMPRPNYDEEPIDVPPQRELIAASPEPAKPAAKKDPPPKD